MGVLVGNGVGWGYSRNILLYLDLDPHPGLFGSFAPFPDFAACLGSSAAQKAKPLSSHELYHQLLRLVA